MGTPQQRAQRIFARVFGGEAPFAASAPGRVNLIGEHTDYNDGLVLPMAIDRRTHVVCRPGPGGRPARVCFPDLGSDGPVEITLAPAFHPAGRRHADTVSAVWSRLHKALDTTASGRLPRSFDAVIAGDVPIGRGLSSSAALEVSVAFALLAMAGAALPPERTALLCRDAEHDVGVPCGVMDQLISACARPGSALLIDCRDLSTRAVSLGDGSAVLVVADSGVRRDLGDGVYADRRESCARAGALLEKKSRGRIASLRDATPDDLAMLDGVESGLLRRRARHVVTEHARTLRAVAAFEAGDFAGAGACMNGSHDSLRDDFGVSCPELDAMVESARACPGVHGSRLTGAGFGGCTVTLVEADHADSLMRRLKTDAARSGRPEPWCEAVQASGGARVEGP